MTIQQWRVPIPLYARGPSLDLLPGTDLKFPSVLICVRVGAKGLLTSFHDNLTVTEGRVSQTHRGKQLGALTRAGENEHQDRLPEAMAESWALEACMGRGSKMSRWRAAGH